MGNYATSGPSAASPLGRAVDYRSNYAPELLFPIERAPKRAELGILRDPPFIGVDLWNAYELSWLNARGKPIVAIGRFTVPASSPRLVESKSLKLYLNSLNAARFDDPEAVRRTIAEDLSAAAGARVGVELAPLDAPQAAREIGNARGELLDRLDIDITDYTLAPDHLRTDGEAAEVSETLVSHLLKSNCLVTGQPDWGTVVVRYRGAPIDRAGLLRYIVSYREHNEFHEQCVERIFMDIRRHCAPRQLAVWARYTRRGGLDINPYRADGESGAPPDNIGDIRQ